MDPKLEVLLVDFEKASFSSSPAYAEFYAIKRNNFFSTIQTFLDIWRSFLALDGIWLREFEDLSSLHDPNNALPLSLFMSAHSFARTAFECAFTGLLNEAWNTFRMGIEAVYHACAILRNPEFAALWTKQGDGTKESDDKFNEAFTANKRRKFEELGLGKLHEWWGNYSDWGHIGSKALGSRYKFDFKPGSAHMRFEYLETKPEVLAIALLNLLLAFHELEKILRARFDDRLKLDTKLDEQRRQFAECAEKARRRIIERFSESFRFLHSPE